MKNIQNPPEGESFFDWGVFLIGFESVHELLVPFRTLH